MRTVVTMAELRAVVGAARQEGQPIGLVPTMGYLHEGHLSLVERSAADNDLTVATIFVNPLQFAAGEDLETYPRDPEGDSEKAASAGADVLFTPSQKEMYPGPIRTTVAVDVAVGFMESATRPTHFDGVATVVAKLLNIVGACRAYFGEKDFQQLAVLRRMTADLNLPVEVMGCPTVREPDGLAMSSRNAYLTAEERVVAPTLHRALSEGIAAVDAGERDAVVVRKLMWAMLTAEPLLEPDYAEVVEAATLERLDTLAGEVRLLVAARLGAPRLLDNLGTIVT